MGYTPSKFSRARDKRGRREPSRSTLSPSSKKHDINDNGTSRRWEDSNPFSAGYEARRKGREKGGQGWSGRQGRKGGSRNVKGRWQEREGEEEQADEGIEFEKGCEKEITRRR